ncbi:hypothetical protein BTO06_16605 [Tenacibaculum sp. SZ-18]|uniref:DUF6970 domain-containing protein n=1 Tax=Tenacibaculum sp. SZ-18 TaxID=754423 RepID=UPI000C2CF771|nr:hypothetical protein [Tenacibaculum sp. SZ-18]AUC16667.1 hypothetical protein BTO06_16605 [Tenacibaculum sp. SZ-18]
MKTVLELICFTIILGSCNKGEEIKVISSFDNPIEQLFWLKKIKTGLEQSVAPVKTEIYEDTYKQERIIRVNSFVGCSDSKTDVYNCGGNLMCKFGGIAGLNTCPDFDSQATNKKLLWKNHDQPKIDKDVYNNTTTDNYSITNIEPNNDTLKTSISYSGCFPDSDRISLVDSESVFESTRLHRLLKLKFLKKNLVAAFYGILEFNINNL